MRQAELLAQTNGLAGAMPTAHWWHPPHNSRVPSARAYRSASAATSSARACPLRGACIGTHMQRPISWITGVLGKVSSTPTASSLSAPGADSLRMATGAAVCEQGSPVPLTLIRHALAAAPAHSRGSVGDVDTKGGAGVWWQPPASQRCKAPAGTAACAGYWRLRSTSITEASAPRQSF